MATKLVGSPSTCAGYVFAIGEDDRLYSISQFPVGGNWSPWQLKSPLVPPGLAGTPSATSARVGVAGGPLNQTHTYVSVAGQDNLLHIYVEGTGWFGGDGAAIAASPFSFGSLTMAVGQDGNLYLRELGDVLAKNGKITSLGAPPPSPGGGSGLRGTVGAAVNSNNFFEIFANGNDANMWHVWQVNAGGGWSPWYSHGIMPYYPVLCLDDFQCLQVFLIGSDVQANILIQLSQTSPSGSWSGFTPIGAPAGVDFQGSPAVTSGPYGLLQIFCISGDGTLWRRSQDPGVGFWADWAGSKPPGVSLQGSPTAAVGLTGNLEVFAIGEDGALWHIWQTEQDGSWSEWFSHGIP